jgi:hypothetical protein
MNPTSVARNVLLNEHRHDHAIDKAPEIRIELCSQSLDFLLLFSHTYPLTPFELNSPDAPEVRALTSSRSRSAQNICFWNALSRIYRLNGFNGLQNPEMEGFWNRGRC